MIDLTTVPRILAKLEYTAVRLPIAYLDECVLALYWDEDAPPRSDVRHFLGSLDEVAGWLLADDEIARRGETLLRRTRAPGPSGAPGAGTPPTGTPAAGEPTTGEPPAGEPTRAAPPEAWSAAEATGATTAAAGPVAPDQARRDAADQARQDAADQARQDAADQARQDAADQARQDAADQARQDAADQARQDAADQARQDAADQARQDAADQARQDAADQARQDAADQARQDAADQARQDAADQARRDAADQAREDTSDTAASAVDVAFSLPADVDAGRVALCGDFNDWSAEATALERGDDGTWQVSVPLEPGRSYRYRYLLDGERWENGRPAAMSRTPTGMSIRSSWSSDRRAVE